MSPTTDTPKLWTPTFAILVAIQTLDLLTYYMVTPLVSTYALSAGADVAFAGVLVGAFTLVAIVVRPISGFLSDRLNRKRLIAVAIAGSCLSMFGYAASPSLSAFLAFRLMHGLCYAVFGTVIAAAAASSLPAARKAEGMGYFSLSYVFASALGPAIGTAASEALGFKSLFCAGGCVLAASLVALLLANIPDSSDAHVRSRVHFSDFISVKCLPLAVVIAGFSFDWGVISGFIVPTAEARGVAGIALFFTVNAIALFITRPPAGRFADRRGLPALFCPAVLFEALAMALLSFASSLGAFIAIGALKALGHGTVHPAIQAECVKLEGEGRTGVASSTFLLGTDIGAGLGPIVGGMVANAAGYDVMYLSCLPVIAGIAVVFLVRQLQRRRA